MIFYDLIYRLICSFDKILYFICLTKLAFSQFLYAFAKILYIKILALIEQYEKPS